MGAITPSWPHHSSTGRIQWFRHPMKKIKAFFLDFFLFWPIFHKKTSFFYENVIFWLGELWWVPSEPQGSSCPWTCSYKEAQLLRLDFEYSFECIFFFTKKFDFFIWEALVGTIRTAMIDLYMDMFICRSPALKTLIYM